MGLQWECHWTTVGYSMSEKGEYQKHGLDQFIRQRQGHIGIQQCIKEPARRWV
jgi:hypothetical protein